MILELKRNSLVFKFSLQVTLILAILLAVLIISNIYSLNVIKSNAVNNSRYAMEIHINNIQNNLNSVAKDLGEIYGRNLDTVLLDPNTDETTKYMETIRLKDVLATKVSNKENIDGLFILDPREELVLSQFSKRTLTSETMGLIDYIKSASFPRESTGKTWKPLRIAGQPYLIMIMKASDLRFGAIIKTDTLMSAVKKSSTKQNQYVFEDNKGELLFSSEAAYDPRQDTEGKRLSADPFIHNRYVITEEIPEIGSLSNIIASKNIFSRLALIQWMILILAVASIVIVPIVLYTLSRDIILPILALVKAAKEVEKGNWDYEISRPSGSFEFTKLFHSFSSMIKEIKGLKIQTYEEQLERNKTELKYLQTQIKPHFYLNAINTITSLTYQNKNEEIRTLIDYLSDYLRYMFKGGLVNVTIREEIEQVSKYIQLQELRFPDQIFYMVEMEEKLEERMLPHFIIQTFVENIFKHALSNGNMLSIFIRVETYEEARELFTRVTVEDNGEGFPQDIIKRVNADEDEESATGHRIGIRNIQKTLKLLYKRDRLLRISNDEPSGARVEILIPAVHEEQQEERHEVPAY